MITQRPRLDKRVSWASCEVVFWKYEKLEKGEVELNWTEQNITEEEGRFTREQRGPRSRQNFERVSKKESVRGLNE